MTAEVPGSRSHEERWVSAATSFERFVPDVEPERVARSFARRLGPLGTFAFEVVGAMWDRPQLSRRDRSLLVITTLAAQARDEELVAHTQIGLRNGLTRTEIEEILPTVAAYAGFPAAMAAARHIDEGLRQAEGVERLSPRLAAEPKDDARRDADGAEVMARMAGTEVGNPADHVDAMTERLGHLGEVTLRWAMGEIWARPELSRRDRSIAVIAILVSLGVDQPLRFHVRAGREHGLSVEEIEEIVTHLGLYAGLPRAIGAMGIVREALADGS